MGQAQSVDAVPVGGGPNQQGTSRHAKVPADLLIPTNIVIDDNEMLQAVQRRIGRGALAPFYAPSENEKDEECPICCDHFRDFNWFTCCNNPICSECFVRLWQERLEALDTAIACPFCKQPEGDAHLRFYRLTEKMKKARRKAEEDSVHAQRRAQQKERQNNPLSSLNATALEHITWAPAAAAPQPPPNVRTPPTPPGSQQRPPSAPASPMPGPTQAPPTPSARAAPGSDAKERCVQGRNASVRPRSRSRTPSVAPSVAELAMEVESAVLERSYHGSRDPSGHGRRDPSRGATNAHSGAPYVGATPHSREPSAHGAGASQSHQRAAGIVQDACHGASTHGGNTYVANHGSIQRDAVGGSRRDESKHHATPDRSSSGRQFKQRFSRSREPPGHGGFGCLPTLKVPDFIDRSLRGHRNASAHSTSARSTRGSSGHGGTSRRGRSTRQKQRDAFSAINATAREHSNWAPHAPSGGLSGALSSGDSRTTPASAPSMSGSNSLSAPLTCPVGSVNAVNSSNSHRLADSSTTPAPHRDAMPANRTQSSPGDLPLMHWGGERSPRHRTATPPAAGLGTHPPVPPDTSHHVRASRAREFAAKTNRMLPSTSSAAARAAQAQLNRGAAPAGAVRPGHHATFHDHVRTHARAAQASAKRAGQSLASVESSRSGALSSQFDNQTNARPSPSTSAAFSMRHVVGEQCTDATNMRAPHASPSQQHAGQRETPKAGGMQETPSREVSLNRIATYERTVSTRSSHSTRSTQSRKVQAEIAAAPEALGVAYSVQPPDSCSAAPMQGCEAASGTVLEPDSAAVRTKLSDCAPAGGAPCSLTDAPKSAQPAVKETVRTMAARLARKPISMWHTPRESAGSQKPDETGGSQKLAETRGLQKPGATGGSQKQRETGGSQKSGPGVSYQSLEARLRSSAANEPVDLAPCEQLPELQAPTQHTHTESSSSVVFAPEDSPQSCARQSSRAAPSTQQAMVGSDAAATDQRGSAPMHVADACVEKPAESNRSTSGPLQPRSTTGDSAFSEKSATASEFEEMALFTSSIAVGKHRHHAPRGVDTSQHAAGPPPGESSQRAALLRPHMHVPTIQKPSSRPPSPPPAAATPRHNSTLTPREGPRQEHAVGDSVEEGPCGHHGAESRDADSAEPSRRKELGHSKVLGQQRITTLPPPQVGRDAGVCEVDDVGVDLVPHASAVRVTNLPEPSVEASNRTTAADPPSRRSSASLSEASVEASSDGGRPYARATNVATSVAAAAASNSASVMIPDESSFSFQGSFRSRSPSGATLYTRVTEVATGVEAEMATGVSTSLTPVMLHDVASDPDLHSTAQHAEASEPLRREQSTPVPGMSEPLVFENSMCSSTSGGDVIHHASRYAEALHVATGVAVAAGAESAEPSMHGSSAADDVSSHNVAANAARVAAGVLRRSDIGEGSSAGASSISFGEDGSMHRRIGAAHVATGASACTPANEGSMHSSISFGTSAHNGRYTHAALVASGVSAASAAADSSSIGGSSISFGDDISIHRLSASGGSPASRTAHTEGAAPIVRRMHAPTRSDSARPMHAGVTRSNSWRTRSRRAGSMHVKTTSMHGGGMHEQSRRSHTRSVSAANASSYAQSVAAGVLASMDSPVSTRARAESAPRRAVVLAPAPEHSYRGAQATKHQHMGVRSPHKAIPRHARRLNQPFDFQEPGSRAAASEAKAANQSVAATSPWSRPPNPPSTNHTADPMPGAHVVGEPAVSNELHSLEADEDDQEATSSELVFAPRTSPDEGRHEWSSRRAGGGAAGGKGRVAGTPSPESDSPVYQSPTQLSAEELWRSDADSQNLSESFHSFSTRTNSTRTNSDVRSAAECLSSFLFLSQRGKESFGEPPPPDDRAPQAWGAAAPGAICQSRDATNSACASESDNTGQSMFAISPAMSPAACDGDNGNVLETTPTAGERRAEDSPSEGSGERHMHTANVEGVSAVVRRSAKHAFLGCDDSAGFSEAAANRVEKQQKQVDAVDVRTTRAQVECESEPGCATLRSQAARRRKRELREGAAAPSLVSAGQQQQRGPRVIAGSSAVSTLTDSRLRSLPRGNLLEASGDYAAPLSREQHREALEQMLPPGVLHSILQQAGEMDDEEFADFLHAFELSCADDPPSPFAV